MTARKRKLRKGNDRTPTLTSNRCGHVDTSTSVKEDITPPLRCVAASVTGVQLIQLQKLFPDEDKGRVPGDPGSSSFQERSPCRTTAVPDRALQNESDSAKLSSFYQTTVKELAVLKRSAIVNSLYGGSKLVIEKDKIERTRGIS